MLGKGMSEANERALEHSWRYFALHSQQRTTVFNFFAGAAGLTLSGLAYVLATESAPHEFGIAAGLGATLLTLVFWKLDQRVAQLTKCAEEMVVGIEGQMFPEEYRIFANADELPVNGTRSPFVGTWSYGRSFRLLFASVAAFGLVGTLISAYGLYLDLDAPTELQAVKAHSG